MDNKNVKTFPKIESKEDLKANQNEVFPLGMDENDKLCRLDLMSISPDDFQNKEDDQSIYKVYDSTTTSSASILTPSNSRYQWNLNNAFGQLVLNDSLVRADITVKREVDTQFDTEINVRNGAVQPDGKVIIIGSFQSYKGIPAKYLVRLNIDGTVDESFNIGTGFTSDEGKSTFVESILIQPDGKVLVGGYFNYYNGVARNGIVRLNTDGSLDTSFNIGTGLLDGVSNSHVYSIALDSNNNIFIGGTFATFNGVSAKFIVKLSAFGDRDSTFNIGTGFNNVVNTIAVQADGKVIVGGLFTSYNGTTRNRIVRLNTDGSRDDSFNVGSGVNNTLNTIAIQVDGKVIIGGNFTTYNGTTRNRIVRLNTDGSRDDSFNVGSGLDGAVNKIVIQPDGKVLVVGLFINYDSAAQGYVRINTNGTQDTDFNFVVTLNSYVLNNCLLFAGVEWYLFGQFTSGVLKVNTITLEQQRMSFEQYYFNGACLAVKRQSDGKLLIGGEFTTFKGIEVNYLVRINPDWSIDESFHVGEINGYVNVIELAPDNKIFIGGSFDMVQDFEAEHLAKLNSDGTYDEDFSVGPINGEVRTIQALSDGKVIIGGTFTTYNGASYNRIVRLIDWGYQDTSFVVGTGFNGDVNSIKLQADGKLIVGGNFTSYNGTTRNRLIRLNTNGSRDDSFNVGTGCNAAVRSVDVELATQKVWVGGLFSSYNGTSFGSNAVIRLSSSAVLEAGDGYEETIRCIKATSVGVLIGTEIGFITDKFNWFNIFGEEVWDIDFDENTMKPIVLTLSGVIGDYNPNEMKFYKYLSMIKISSTNNYPIVWIKRTPFGDVVQRPGYQPRLSIANYQWFQSLTIIKNEQEKRFEIYEC